MRTSLAQRYLMEALAVPKSMKERLRKRVSEGKCITEGCDNELGSRGLCDNCRQHFYLALRKQPDEQARIQFERDMVDQGMVLPPNTQREWTTKNPFLRAKAAS